ncbi:DUF1254 domain-containing protein [Herbiconiux flava]|uniref:DUF1254 domain-containing protein n=1 Tax=Herbiconiux flava TaxID=881268 RepID=A0A852STJ2_9MICO|nr:DUF1254 domain-containing protein [Herbiconiux flava]NYD72053.1 hypothetical protein [Herbiconiux flava]GLK17984.1 hypothetical protein GCM10017602_24660 [Herbiconiux flava]
MAGDDTTPKVGLPGRLAGVEFDGELPARTSVAVVFDELDYQFACQAYLWALPLVSYAQWKTQHYDVFGATSSDLVRYLSYQDRLGLITANATTPYILNFFDLAETGPLVVELPAGPTAGGVSDFWQREVGAMGEMGPDHGEGGKYVILAPGVDAPDGIEADYRTLRSSGVNIMFGFRTLDPDPARADALVHAVRIHPYADRADPRPTRIVSPDGRPWTGDQPRGLDYWRRLHEIYQSEIVDERDRFYLAMLKQLGIEKGKPFAPDARLQGILEQGAAAGELMAQANTFAKRFEQGSYWPDRAWEQAIVLDDSAQRGEGYDELLERASWFYEAVSFSEAMKSTTPGVGQAYLGSYTDAAGEWLDGGRDYTLHVPAEVPAKLFWSATVYDVTTRCLIDNEQQRGDRGSRDEELVVNEDGSVDLYFGPSAPASGEANWVQTIPGRHWFSYFRFYGPLEPYLDRSWKLGDITAVEARS